MAHASHYQPPSLFRLYICCYYFIILLLALDSRFNFYCHFHCLSYSIFIVMLEPLNYFLCFISWASSIPFHILLCCTSSILLLFYYLLYLLVKTHNILSYFQILHTYTCFTYTFCFPVQLVLSLLSYLYFFFSLSFFPCCH